jgi:hypothetical protein
MVACLVNLEATGNQGLVANRKVELCRKSVMLYHFLVKLLKTTEMTRYRIDQEEYTSVQEGDPTIKHICGLNLWTMMCEEIWPQTKVSTNDLETKLSKMTFTACDTRIPALITNMLHIKHQNEAEKGVTYKPDCFMTLFFDKLSSHNNEMFHYEFIAARSAYNKGKMTQDEVFEALKLVYRTEQATGTWADLTPSKHEITMLTTNLAKANIQLHKMKSSSGGGGRGGNGGRGGRTRRGNGNRGAGNGGCSGNNAAKFCTWMLKGTTNTIKHPSQGYKMKWCKLCGLGRTKGTHAGIYMQAPHNHAKWLLSKNETLVKFNAKKKSLKAKKSKASDDNDSTNNNVKRLKLCDSIINGLTTEIMIGDSKACKMAKRWF